MEVHHPEDRLSRVHRGKTPRFSILGVNVKVTDTSGLDFFCTRKEVSVPKVLPHYDHIPLHRLWAFSTLQTDLTLPEYSHIVDCEECRIALQTCMEAVSFGAALKELMKDRDDDHMSEAS